MAIQYLRNALGPTTSTTSVSVTLPATAAGDLLIFEYVHRGTGTGTIGGTSVSTGGLTWNNKHDQLFGASAFSGHTYWTIATGDHSGQTVTASSLTNSSAGIVTVYSGAHQTTPLDDATVVGEQNASADEGQAAITTATNGAWVVLVVVNSPDLAVSSQAAANLTLTERAERLSTGGTDASIAHASGVLATAGSSGAFTWAQTNAASGSWAYAIKPAPMVGSGSGTIAATGAGTGTSVSVYQGNAWMPGAWASGAWAAGAWEVTATTHSGSGTGTIAASTGAGTGTKARAGTGAGTLAASTGSGAGLKARSGVGAGTLAAATGAGTGTFYSQFYGSGAGDLAALTGTGTGLKARSGLGAGTLTALTGSGSGVAAGQFYGAGAGTISLPTGAGTGLKERAGTGAGVIAALTGAGTGTSAGVFTGSGAGTIAALTGSGTGSSVEMVCAWDHGAWAPGAWASGAWQCAPATTDGTGTGTIAALTGSGTGLRSHASTGAGTIAALTGSGTGVEDTWILVSFATPTSAPTPGTDLQAFRVLVRKTDTANPTIDIALYEDGAFVATLVSATSVTSDTGQVVTATWDAALLSDPTGADVECYVYGHSNGASQVEIGAIAWDVAQGFTGSGAGTVAALSGTGTGLRSHASTGAGTISAATGAGTGTSEGPQTWTATGAGTFPALAGTGTGLRGAKGSGTGTIAVTGTGTGGFTTTWIGTGAGVLGIVVGSGTGARPHSGSGTGTISAPTGAGNGPQTGKVGGDDRPRHPGWSKKRATLKLKRERELTEQIRDIYRELTADPETAAQAETILAPVIPPTPATGETEAARTEAIEARAEALRRRADAMDARAIEAEIALRVLYRQLREQMIADDWAAIEALLPEVL